MDEIFKALADALAPTGQRYEPRCEDYKDADDLRGHIAELKRDDPEANILVRVKWYSVPDGGFGVRWKDHIDPLTYDPEKGVLDYYPVHPVVEEPIETAIDDA